MITLSPAQEKKGVLKKDKMWWRGKIISTMGSAGASKPSGKATGWPGTKKRKKIYKILACFVTCQPDIKGFGVSQFGARQPVVGVGAISKPSN